ncbi:glycosyltransferase involved in cell wall biosynthesis [Pseudoduganella flava]|uniref:Glycosyltransferase n=1 Tax=Pseudoduganella flava TaxID=871742 RepID=A0A562Q0F8_9BURK|nr:glycosyltransferase family 2 protein [Pseudoduganella flava]QGZ38323.1 glycosyltransferase [Pseudoduganella flava]TWI50138.1 glycosyltransferase involved in cell wall biosynthesis [Pseudoduganella flava]
MDLSSIPPETAANASLSVVLPVLNEAPALATLLPALAQVLGPCGVAWEIVIVDDGSTDTLPQVVAAFERQHAGISMQVLHLSRNFGKEAALTAGLAAARGDAVVCMDGDGQHPPALLPTLVAHWRDGAQMVIAMQRSRAHEQRWTSCAKGLFYRLLQGGERFRIPAGAGDFRLMDRRVVQAMLQLSERARFMKGLYAWLGFRTVTVPYDAAPRCAGASKFPLCRLLELASLGITSFSMKPLRMVSAIGGAISLCAVGYGIYIAIDALVVGNPVSGWATLASGMMLLSGIQLLCLGVIAEYLGYIFEETKQRPLYVIDEVIDHSTLGRRAAARTAP